MKRGKNLMEIKNDNINAIKLQIQQTESDINVLTNRLESMEEERAKLTADYEDKKTDFETFKRQYAEQSTYGVYFLIVSFIAFVFVAYKVIRNEMIGFMIIPATILFVIGLAGKIMGDRKFHTMKNEMGDKEMAYADSKKVYDDFMAVYNADANLLEEKQYEWELVENNMIEAKKDAWIAAKKKKKLADA